MDGLTFFGLERPGDDNHWSLPVVPHLCSGLGALFGGCGLGAAIEVLEQTTGRPCVWATCQFLSFARPPAVVDLEVAEVVRGRHTSQARVLARVEGEEIFTVLASLGKRSVDVGGQWAIRPVVPPPEDCSPRLLLPQHQGTIVEHLDTRLADARMPDALPGPPGNGTSSLWLRFRDLDTASAAALAIVGDFVPFGVGQALGRRMGGNSLDNTLRVAARIPTDWVLADVRVHSVADGFAHGLVHLWAENGTLLATASQSAIVRAWSAEQGAASRNLASPSGEGPTAASR